MTEDDRSSGLRQRLRYRLDNLLARGTWAVLVWLGAVTALTVLVSAAVLALFGVSYQSDDDSRWSEDAWQSLLRVMDPGTMAGDVGWGRRLLALAITVFGILVAGTLIGVIAAGVEDRVDRMRRGRSAVIERDHVVVLGGGERLPFIVRELVLAADADRPPVIVVLTEADPADVHAAMRGVVDDLRGVRFVVRSGDPMRRADLALVRLDRARSVLVVGVPDNGVRVALAVVAESGGTLRIPMVVDVSDRTTALRLTAALGPNLHPMVTPDAVARIAAFSLRQGGLSTLVEELIDAPGVGIRITAPGAVAGDRFGDLVASLDRARPIGRIDVAGVIELMPPADARMGADDCLVMIATDGRLDRVAEPRAVAPAGRAPTDDAVQPGDQVDQVVVVGWSAVGERMLDEWRVSATSGSTLTLIDRADGAPAATARAWNDDRVTVLPAGTDAVDVALTTGAAALVVLANAADGPDDIADVDASTLLEVATMRRRLEGIPARPRLVVELADADSGELLALDGPDDVTVSDAIASAFAAQLVIDPRRRDVLLALYDRRPPDLSLVDGARLGLAGRLTMAELIGRAYDSNMLAIGWRDDASGDLVLAPALATTVDWTDRHRLVVIR